ncbi:MAG: hypothetical protein V4773_08170 [Verrucomicrobiota bacterium]
MSKKVLLAAFAACLFVLILTAKWATFDRYGSAMPDWDQWDAEAVQCFIPWFHNDNFLEHLFRPHNEHRIVLTKLQNLALVLLNGQWDARLQAVTNAALHSALGAGFWLLGCCFLFPSSPSFVGSRVLRLALSASLFLLAFTLFGLPLAWQNVLGGFHSQQYWLAGLSFIAIVTLPFARSWSAAWWAGIVSAILVLGSMGSGFLASAAVLVVIAFRVVRRETTFRELAPAFAVSLACVVFGLLTRHEVSYHADMKAKTVHDFVFTIIHSLEWPWRDRHWAALVLWLPWLVLACRVFKKDLSPASARAGQTILALGGWVLLQLAATAYARGAGADYPASRYMDALTFGTMANALALAWLFAHRAPALGFSAVRILLPLVAFAWLTTLGAGIQHYLSRIVRWELEGVKKYYTAAEGNMRRYLATDDRKYLDAPDLPFPSTGLVERLAVPSLRSLMAVPLRAPLALKPATSSPAFVLNNAIGADSANPPRLGLSPATPPLDYVATWGTHAAAEPGGTPTGTWKSAPLAAPLGGWLKFETAGGFTLPGEDKISLSLHDAQTGRHLADIRPHRPPGDTWRSAYVRAPRAPFIVVAHDESARSWLAFSPPVEMASLSFYAWQATRHAALVFWSATAITFLLAAFALLRARPTAP